MRVSYDVFIGAFLEKISEYEFAGLSDETRSQTVNGYFHRAVSEFRKNCKYQFAGAFDDDNQTLDIEFAPEDLDELTDIISEGMVVQWLKPYLNHQENLQNAISTRDYSVYSPSELLKQVGAAYDRARRNYIQMIREYSYNHGDLTKLHI